MCFDSNKCFVYHVKGKEMSRAFLYHTFHFFVTPKWMKGKALLANIMKVQRELLAHF